MNETFKQLKKSEDNVGPVLLEGHKAQSTTGSGTTISKKNQVSGLPTKKNLDNEDRMMMAADEESKAINETRGKKNQSMFDDGVQRNKSGQIEDDEDILSDNEKEVMNDLDNDIDGNVKVAKDVRGYDDNEEDNFS
jgi:hypothetical protein